VSIMPEEKVAQLDALRLAEALRRRLVDFTADDHFARNARLTEICRRLWEGKPETGGLLSELWVEGAFPAELCSSTLDGLAGEGKFNPDLRDQLDRTGAMPRDRRLYTHQREAILRAQERGPAGEKPALVVTAGTGAGKTECFLLPILNDSYGRDGNGAGVQCLILYPMNALVNDQVDRLYGWLKGQTKVTLFHFTSETPEDKHAADYDRVPRWEPCRFRTRQEARGLETRSGENAERGHIPDIVITNYSMLEYMLCRPQDSVFFGPSLRAVVLDEAHLYTGTLAAEITLLLRRLYARCGVDPKQALQIATSATLRTGDEAELHRFTATLFSKDESLVHVIEGRNSRAVLAKAIPPTGQATAEVVAAVRWIDQPLVIADVVGNVKLSEDRKLCDRLRQHLPLLTAAAALNDECLPARLLYATLRASPLIHRLEGVLWDRKRMALPELAESLWGTRDEAAVKATTALLQLGASAREQVGDYPLVPHRIHLLARPADGLVVCLNAECPGRGDYRLPPLGAVSAGVHDRCPVCVGAVVSLYRCANCGEWLLAGLLDGNRYRPVGNAAVRPDFFTIRHEVENRLAVLTLSPAKAERSGAGQAGVQVALVTACPHCGSDREDFEAFGSGTPLTLAILAETVLAELPEFPAPHNRYLPARGRRMLSFSDSRQEAARLGPRLTRQHETQLVRAAIVQVLSQNLAADEETIRYTEDEVQHLQQKLQRPLAPALRQRLETDLQRNEKQLKAYRSGGAMEDWARSLESHRLLAELLDPDTGQNHVAREETSHGPRDWSQRDWDKNWEQAKRHALTFLAREFATPNWRAISAETVGLAEITYPGLDALEPPSKFIGILPNEGVRNAVLFCWSDILHALCDTLRVEGVITLGDKQANIAFQSGRVPVGQWCAKRDDGYFLRRFVGEKLDHRRRRFAAAVLQACRMSKDDASRDGKELLEAAFDQLFAHAFPHGETPGTGELAWLERHDGRQTNDGPPAPALRLVFPHLGLRRPPALFQCKQTGHVWCRSVQGCAPERGCDGNLGPVDDRELDEDPRLGRLRREYRESPVFRIGLWAEEHSAQLTPKENRRLQDLFRAGIRNILSATTTLELGIDIGGLAAVLTSNVPPGKANYLQRAGRAGRRADGSSVVVTFARPRPFDREVFRRFDAYLDKPLRRPLVFLGRDRVVRRHLHAYLLGEFFRSIYGPDQHKGAMTAFGNMGQFCGKPKVPYWEDKGSRPVVPEAPPSLEAQFLAQLFHLRDYGDGTCQASITRLFAGTHMATRLGDWHQLIKVVIEDFSDAVRDWNGDYELLYRAWLDAAQAGDKAQANAIRYQLNLLWELTVIEALADRQFLPRYGFPIGLQKLRVIAADEKDRAHYREEDQFRLERSGLLAIGEYVPGSQLLAGGKLVTSRGLLKSWIGEKMDAAPGLRGRFCRCENDHAYYWIADAADQCPICQARPKEGPRDLLFVKHGFTSAAWDPPKWSTDVDRVGTAETLTITFKPSSPPDGGLLAHQDLGGVKGLSAYYREDGELLVYNRGDCLRGFAICLKCGYAESEDKLTAKGKMDLPAGFHRHPPITATRPWVVCWKHDAGAAVLRNQILAARETTDVLLLDFSGCLGHGAADDSLVTTLAYAFQRSGTQLLELDSRELGVLVVPTGEGGRARGAVLYDNVPGGAGHVRELIAQEEQWLQTTRQVLYVDSEHNARCETACLDCLLSFDAQMAMLQRPFVRRRALAQLDALLRLS
jgi:Lhr-like helicase